MDTFALSCGKCVHRMRRCAYHLKRVHVRGHFRTLSEARDVSRSSPLLSFQSCSTMFWIHYSPRLCASTTQRSTSENESILQYLTAHSLALHLACCIVKWVNYKTLLWASLEMILQSQTCKAARTTKICRKLWLFRWNHWRTALAQSWAHFWHVARKVSAMKARNSLSLL